MKLKVLALVIALVGAVSVQAEDTKAQPQPYNMLDPTSWMNMTSTHMHDLTPGQTVPFNPFHPAGWAMFADPKMHNEEYGPAQPGSIRTVHAAWFYMQAMNPNNWMAWMNPANYAVMMDPKTMAYWMNPAAYNPTMHGFYANDEPQCLRSIHESSRIHAIDEPPPHTPCRQQREARRNPTCLIQTRGREMMGQGSPSTESPSPRTNEI